MTSKKGKGAWRRWVVSSASVAAAVSLWAVTPADAFFKRASSWQRFVDPGALSQAHARLEADCGACHTAVSGADDLKCILCHASEEAILKRQPTTFHAHVGKCSICHREHRGRGRRPVDMDHEALARLGVDELLAAEPASEARARGESLLRWRAHGAELGVRQSLEGLLDCSPCHSNEDRHFGLFGRDCGTCHRTDRWTLPRFRHPPPRSRDCAHCHQAPPSHYMMHFKMISARVAGKPRARVDQCFFCHQTTSWPDIVDVGFYKHH